VLTLGLLPALFFSYRNLGPEVRDTAQHLVCLVGALSCGRADGFVVTQGRNTAGYYAVGQTIFLEEIPTEVIFEHRGTRRENEDKDRAAYLHGNRVDWGLAFYDRVSTPDVLERCSRASVVAVLFGSSLQLVGALTS
jgi:hypothetical protein